MSDSADQIGERLRQLDLNQQPDALNAVALAKVVARSRARKRVQRKMAAGVAVCGMVASCVWFIWPDRLPEVDSQVVATVEGGDVNDKDLSAEGVKRLKREFEVFQRQSEQMAEVLTRLDRVIQQQAEIERRFNEFERRAWEASIRMKQSESLTVDVAYDFGY